MATAGWIYMTLPYWLKTGCLAMNYNYEYVMMDMAIPIFLGGSFYLLEK